MHEFAIKPSLEHMPPEVLSLMFPDPTRLRRVSVAESNPYTQWLAIMPLSALDTVHLVDVREAMGVLRALSQTCRKLRALTLPLLWKVTNVRTVAELGKLRELFKLAPTIASHVRSFTFQWTPRYYRADEKTCFRYASYPAAAGSLLTMAFRDRRQMWEDLAQEFGCEILRQGGCEILRQGVEDGSDEDLEPSSYAAYAAYSSWLEEHGSEGSLGGETDLESNEWSDSETYDESEAIGQGHAIAEFGGSGLSEATGQGHAIVELGGSGLSAAKSALPAGKRYFQLQQQTHFEPGEGRASGPDGNGEDDLIKNAVDLESCLVEVIAQLRSLETFGWGTYVLPMPTGVLDAVSQCTMLKSLHLTMSLDRGLTHILPFWKLAVSLNDLSFDFARPQDTQYYLPEGQADLLLCAPFAERKSSFRARSAEFEEEQNEAVHATFELPLESPTSAEDLAQLHRAIVYRTIITAAKGGHLRHLTSNMYLQVPFSIRSLLPHWIAMESWHGFWSEGWMEAAQLIRPLLSYISSRLGTKQDRTLTRANVQTLQQHLKADVFHKHVAPRDGERARALVRYLDWLKEDDELAQRAVDAWNAIVSRGEEDLVKNTKASAK